MMIFFRTIIFHVQENVKIVIRPSVHFQILLYPFYVPGTMEPTQRLLGQSGVHPVQVPSLLQNHTLTRTPTGNLESLITL